MKRTRQLNFEILRIVSMLMIVTLHYLDKGGALTKVTEEFSVNSYVAWLVEAFCIMSVNLYVLITGYFSSGTSFSIKKIGRIWGQVLFYSIVIGGIALAIGMQDFDIYAIFRYVFPVSTEHYWFATEYLLLCILMPFLNAGFEKMEQKTVLKVIGLLLLICAVAKTFIPMRLPSDQLGYDVLWFVCIYLTGAYIREYRISLIKRRRNGLILGVVCGVAIFASMFVLREIYIRTGRFENLISYAYSYNHLLCYVGSVGLFIACDKRKPGAEDWDSKVGWGKRLIYKVAGATFGVYLIHEHWNIRYLWPQWFASGEYVNAPLGIFVLHMVFAVLIMFCVCTLIELLRQKMFLFIGQKWIVKERKHVENQK